NRVDISDMSAKAFKEMLQYVYTGRPKNLEAHTKELLFSADKYALQDLRNMCEVTMRSNITVETVAEIISLADTCSAEQLKGHALHFFTVHAASVVKTEGWKALAKNCPQL